MNHLSENETIRFAADELPAGARQALEAHVNDCAACRAAIEAQRALCDGLGEWTVDAGARDLWPGLAQRLDHPGAHAAPTGYRFGRIAAAVLLGLGAGYGTGRLASPLPMTAAQRPPMTADAALSQLGLGALAEPSATGLYAALTPDAGDREETP